MRRHVIISGGGSGLGLGLATRLLKRGEHISVLDLSVNADSQNVLDDSAQTGDGRWQFHAVDLTEADAVEQAVDAAVASFGVPQLAINSAGIAINRTLDKTSPAEFAKVMQVNLGGSFNFAHAVLPRMRAGSRLALIASIAGLTSNYGYTAYGSSKFGVVGLATTLRYEYEPKGIAISCICPPEVKTPMVTAERADGDPVSLDLKLVAGSMEAEAACDEMLKGLDRGRWLIIPGHRARLTARLSRHLPQLSHWTTMRLVNRLLRKHGRTV